MDLYKLNQSRLEEVKNVPFKLEKDIQDLIEANLQTLFDLEMVRSEFPLNNLRIDTLAYDQQRNAFVIIEYKKTKNFSVIDQGYSYLSLMLNNKADFILEYQEQTANSMKRDEVDWSQSRVLFISPQFTPYQKQSIEFKDLPFELWEIKKYSNDTLILNQHKSSSNESIKTIENKDVRAEQVDKEVVVYTEEELVSRGGDDIRELYSDLKERLLESGEYEIKPLKYWINFKNGKKIIGSIELQRRKLKVWVNLKAGNLDDPKKMFEDVSSKGHWGIGDYEAVLNPQSDLDYLMSCIKQSYNYHYNA
ncbi:MAG: hypothetical protein CMB80_34110 [Flammeovirgaceae bacterium]|nr:hypothetical protein [Flammeovirgaceae bacterium]HCX24025.1 hypothetical protein [Cytophagales bacterium]|tara:strand:+ start:3591 stop:4508 length:918 start_codon:yes stop_codon:yes gene_type:complete